MAFHCSGLAPGNSLRAQCARDAAISDVPAHQIHQTTPKDTRHRSPVHSFGCPAISTRVARLSPWGSRRTTAAMGKPPLTTRRRYHIALGAARHLFAGGEISATGCGALKNHIFDDDGRVAAAVEIYWLNDDGDALRATLRALGGPSWSVETERRINDHVAAYHESVRAHNEAYRRSDIRFVAGMPMLGQKNVRRP